MRIMLPLAAVAIAATGLAVAPPASADQEAPQGCSVVVPSASFDYDAYIAARKAELSARRAAMPSLF